MTDNPDIQLGLDAAREAREKAYAPYSRLKVGAALKLKDLDTIYSGCNVENASYGATVCAERTAVWKAVTEFDGKPEIEWLVLVTDRCPPSPPCGICLQVLSEFSSTDTQIYLANSDGVDRVTLLNNLLPEAFKF